MSKRKIKPAAKPAAPAWRVTSAHLNVPGMAGRAVVVSKSGLYDWKIPGDDVGPCGTGLAPGCERTFEAACRAAVRAMPNKHRAWCLNTDPAWTITGAIMEIPGAAVRRLSVQQIGDVIEWRAINEGRVADSGAADSVSRCQAAAEQWARGAGWMCPKCGGQMHECKTGDAGCFHCDDDKCDGVTPPRGA